MLLKRAVFILFIFLTCHIANGQAPKYDSLKHLLATATGDSLKYQVLQSLIFEYIWTYPDSAPSYIRQQSLLVKQMKSDQLLFRTNGLYFWYFIVTGDYAQALFVAQENLKLAEKLGDPVEIAQSYNEIAAVYEGVGDYKRSLSINKKGLSVFESKWKPPFKKDEDFRVLVAYTTLHNGLALNYNHLGFYDSALLYARKLDEQSRTLYSEGWAAASFLFGNIYVNLKDYHNAIHFYHLGIDQALKYENNKDLMDNCTGLANTYKLTGEYDSSISYATKTIDISKSAHNSIARLSALRLLSDVYQSKRMSDSTVKYLQLTIAANDSMFNSQKITQIQNMTFNEEQRQQRMRDEQAAYRAKIRTYALGAGLLCAFAVSIVLYRNNRQKQKARVKVEKAYAELKSTQAQLIQSEKMASLGELTAGIAHEIQNPLNFVNNFSEVNNELISELVDEADKGNLDGVKSIAKNIKDNGEKINHHGRRADSIVKGMLQHTRISSGQKELTNINALADEYLRLAYHGFRAKDKSFNASVKTEFDNSIDKINVIPSEIGRIMLNIINNAFYAVSAKATGYTKASPDELSAGSGYSPMVTVSTSKNNGKVEITVKDNGNGIAPTIAGKIFQPFFTTKPTGQGTGLGLSLAYDSVKAHGGEITVDTIEGKGSAFVIRLPVQS